MLKYVDMLQAVQACPDAVRISPKELPSGVATKAAALAADFHAKALGADTLQKLLQVTIVLLLAHALMGLSILYIMTALPIFSGMLTLGYLLCSCGRLIARASFSLTKLTSCCTR